MSKILKKYKARIFGDVYTLVSDEDDSVVLEVVYKVDSLMKEYAAKPALMGDAKRIAVLVALKMAEELLMNQNETHQDQIHVEKILKLLDNQSDMPL
jgi:hypothetical protein